ncbi:3-phosphoserine/phosphohydroxythreonine transaminase [Segetibacter sp. 3557_3]|uniref:3-phosphoserine/phosphohydroxythreonine transaminase n=1 Tax=Segetibacter sp. 3557_3 TaxID=2547429 RepID=UPI0010584CE8|nr:3-phosphoserine/phosphohydroxythreonine transaminase [Segetibacter sp. 3557_3]TDH26187.1 3-phosphoserine/phosphohydroxythreonine transaminase [Segetibacter sp. 3557_3]
MVHNFNAGPGILPQAVLEQAARAILNIDDTGLSILEIGHRTPLFEGILHKAVSLVKELMNLDADHEVLFLHGGASTQFMQVPMNLLNTNETAAYIDNGIWGSKAIKEAKLFGNVDVVASSADKNHTYITKTFSVPHNAKYLHYTTNNTVEGTQWQHIPESNGVSLVADMSSDIFSRELNFNAFDLIYAGAQKNMGAAGVNLLVVNKNILGKVDRKLPTIMDYRNHIANGSMLNTPPVFAIYVSMLTLQWLKDLGGVKVMEAINDEKASFFYDTLDSLPQFTGPVAREDRSKMNAVFVMKDPGLEKLFIDYCKSLNLYGIKGHRSVGGFRVSLYNALPLSSVQVVCDAMKAFASQHG